MIAVAAASDNDLPVVVCGWVPLDPCPYVANTATLAVRHAQQSEYAQQQQQQLVEQYAARLSAAFEELTFLRRLSRHVEYCVADRSLADAAQSILPQLRDLIGLEGMCLIGSDPDSETGKMRAGCILRSCGRFPGTIEFWRGFIGQIGDSGREIVVKNYQRQLAREMTPLSGLRSVLVVPVEKDGYVFGWLLGVNKQPTERVPSQTLGRDEIGSMEASLLEAAALMLGSHAANNRLYHEKEALVVDVIHTLVGVIEAKDPYTCGHSDRVALVACRLGAELGLDPAECHDIFLSGLLHDIGKIGVGDDVLLKPGRLSDDEFATIKRHPEIGARLLQGLRPLEKLIPGVLHHHEATDGSGYPYGLAGEEIPLMARILAVADAFDAMTSDRPYRSGMPLAEAESILRDGADKQWDGMVVSAYFSARNQIAEIGAQWRDHLEWLLNWRSQPEDHTSASPIASMPPAAAAGIHHSLALLSGDLATP